MKFRGLPPRCLRQDCSNRSLLLSTSPTATAPRYGLVCSDDCMEPLRAQHERVLEAQAATEVRQRWPEHILSDYDLDTSQTRSSSVSI